ncbi:carbonic anhydrase [Methylopila capsulata]|uniref:Carbonic anhydrase n=1 Tax=Methylopila capsulata TaxID=61654 RepID=A0A9W6ISU2_9HYPH|nr:carbonic anhydrase [Methylopila capsulata]MBM7851654.1 carbonic anhydrase [Methylopila capsulata]GLK54714.1 carbonic anhydrase [Methylopila capsulata]
MNDGHSPATTPGRAGSLDALFDGYRRFRAEAWPELQRRFERLAQGQSPKVMVIGCSDSRVDPQQILGAAPGQLFVLRNVAALVPPYAPDQAHHGASAAVEFAVRVLQVHRIVVLGHAGCGGVKALFQGAPAEASDFVVSWMDIADEARAKVDASLDWDERERLAEQACAEVTVANLMTFPWVRERVEDGSLAISAMHFGVANGCLRCRDDARGVWCDVPTE